MKGAVFVVGGKNLNFGKIEFKGRVTNQYDSFHVVVS